MKWEWKLEDRALGMGGEKVELVSGDDFLRCWAGKESGDLRKWESRESYLPLGWEKPKPLSMLLGTRSEGEVEDM